MSVDLPLNVSADVLNPIRPGADQTVTDLIIVYGGWQAGVDPLQGGSPLPGAGSGTADLIRDLKAVKPNPFHRTLVIPMQGSLPSMQGVGRA